MVDDVLTIFPPPSRVTEGLLWLMPAVVGRCYFPIFPCDSDSSVPRPSVAIREMNSMEILGKQVTLWGVQLTWQNTPWCSYGRVKSFLMIRFKMAFKDFDVGDGTCAASCVVFRFSTQWNSVFWWFLTHHLCLRVSVQRVVAINHKGTIQLIWNYFSRNTICTTLLGFWERKKCFLWVGIRK